jgi:hypothetical protein
VEYFNNLGSVTTNDTRYTRESKYNIVMEKAAFNRENFSHQQRGPKFKKESSEVLYFEYNNFWRQNTHTLRKINQNT